MNKEQILNFFNHFSALGSKEIFIFYIIIFFLLDLKQLSLKLLIGMILIYLIAIPIRYLYFKERPTKKQYKNILEKIDASSFPSMHSARTTFLLMTLTKFLNFEIKITIFLTLTWAIILYARIYKKKHDYKDIIGGIILGLIPYLL